MNFFNAVKSGFCNVNFADAGRASRSEFWYWMLFCNVSVVLVALLQDMLGMGSIFDEADGTLVLCWLLVLTLPGIAMNVRRLHDLDKSGWWVLLDIIPLIGMPVMLFWMCFKGTPGPNRYGEDPLLKKQIGIE